MTRLCVSIFFESVEQVRRDVSRAIESGADMIELRIDTADVAQVRAGISGLATSFIFTCRSVDEGGQSDDSDDERLTKMTSLASKFGGLIDLEWRHFNDRIDDPADAKRPEIITSLHDFVTRPDKLTGTYLQMCSSSADVVKVVWRARTVRDNFEAFELLSQKQKPTIALCMGETGLLSRILAKKFGAYLTFARLDTSAGTAPGQPSVDELKHLYRWDLIRPSTRLFGVVGSPVSHSMSPAIHNASFDHTQFDGLYVPFLVEPGYESFKAFMETARAFESFHLRGLSITLPHKENAIRYLREQNAQVDPLASHIGAVNTIDLRTTGEMFGTNTDYDAILDTITAGLGNTRGELAGVNVCVIGAGGTGRTAVCALAAMNANVTIVNRSRDKADALASEFDGKTGPVVARDFDALASIEAQVFVNTTKLGMNPQVDSSAFDGRLPRLQPNSLVFDTVYNPPFTKLLAQAGAAGAATASGVDMFIRQAAGQFSLWTGLDAPVEIMRRVVESRLK